MFLFSEPDEVKKTKTIDYDPVSMGPVKAIPEGFTIYDKIVIKEGSLTIEALFNWLKEHYSVTVYSLASGTASIYNEFAPGGKHASRKQRKVEDVYKEVSEEEFMEGRDYMVLVVVGETISDGSDFSMPPIVYYFR